MELVLALLIVFLISAIFGIGFLVGAKQQHKNRQEPYTTFNEGVPQWSPPTSSAQPISTFDTEVPDEWLASGDKERALHIAGIKEASWEKQKEWQAERQAKQEEKSALSDKQLMEYIEKKNAEILVKAGLKDYDKNKGVEDLSKILKKEDKVKVSLADIATPKGYDPLKEEKMKREAARKQAQKDREEMEKIDFEALPMSRISNEARKQIAEIVRKDIADKLEAATNVLPEVKENEQKKTKTKKSTKVKH